MPIIPGVLEIYDAIAFRCYAVTEGGHGPVQFRAQWNCYRCPSRGQVHEGDTKGLFTDRESAIRWAETELDRHNAEKHPE